MVPNPHTLQPMVPVDSKWFTALHLMDAFFCILMDKQAQLLFVFEWQDPEVKAMHQYCWTVLPQDLRTL